MEIEPNANGSITFDPHVGLVILTVTQIKAYIIPAFVAGTSTGIMLTIWDPQRVKPDSTFDGLVQLPKTLFKR